jgi:hypothetical protein
VLDIKLETEEMFESRSYLVVPHPASVILIADRMASVGTIVDERTVAKLTTCLMTDSSLKILSKRTRGGTGIDYLVTFVNPYVRLKIERSEVEDETAFRSRIDDFERELLDSGLLDEPTVLTREDWQQYERQPDLH